MAAMKTEEISKFLDFFEVTDLIYCTVSLSSSNGRRYKMVPSAMSVANFIIPEFTAPRKTGIFFLEDGCIIFISFSLKKFPSKLIVSPLEIILKQVTYSFMRFKGYSRSEERRVGKECRSRWCPDL